MVDVRVVVVEVLIQRPEALQHPCGHRHGRTRHDLQLPTGATERMVLRKMAEHVAFRMQAKCHSHALRQAARRIDQLRADDAHIAPAAFDEVDHR